MARRRRTRSATSPIPPVEAMFEERKLKGEYGVRPDVLKAFQRRHEKGVTYIDEKGYWSQNGYRWHVPYGVRAAFQEQLTFSQIANKYPFYVEWREQRETRRRPCSTLATACAYIAQHLAPIDDEAFIVAKNGFYIPSALMGKFPRRMGPEQRLHYWCPRCMQPRTFRRAPGDQTFWTNKKYMVDDNPPRFEWKNVRLAVLECSHCGLTNRDSKFRASNQPVEKVRIRRRRAKR